MEEKQESRSADLSSQGLNVDRDPWSLEEVDWGRTMDAS